jgi:hypothetical protein
MLWKRNKEMTIIKARIPVPLRAGEEHRAFWDVDNILC